ncbi:MAG: glycosyltransferase family 4 protein [Myxococcales bacterium]|nr:glycosyltransferase family 4 protein [Myxococcales bacterium]
MNHRPTIALCAPSSDILGGQSVQAATLCRALRADGWSVDFVPVNPRFPRGLGWLRRIPYARTVLNEALYAAACRALRRADVVHIFTASYVSFLLVAVPALLAARRFGKRTILNYHSGEADDHLRRYGPLVHPWLRLADTIVVPSAYLERVFARHGHVAAVVPNAIDVERFRFRERSTLRPLCLSNRNLEPHYRVADIVAAHALLCRAHRDAELVIAGTGSERERLASLASTLPPGAARFVGRVEPERMPALYDSCDVFVNASVVDNQPLSILESFAAGLPVVTTATGDIEAMVRHGDTGLLVPPRQPGALAGAVESLLAAPVRARDMTRRARAEVERYRWPAVRQRWAAVYAGGAA